MMLISDQQSIIVTLMERKDIHMEESTALVSIYSSAATLSVAIKARNRPQGAC